MTDYREAVALVEVVSVLFNEPKLLKSSRHQSKVNVNACFSALQRAEIAEILPEPTLIVHTGKFQCSSTSRNC